MEVVEVRKVSLAMARPFRVSRNVTESCDSVLVVLRDRGYEAYGIATPSSFYGETPSSAYDSISFILSSVDCGPLSLERLSRQMDSIISNSPSAKAAVDMAYYDLYGKMLRLPLYRLLGLSDLPVPSTSVSIGIAPIDEVLEQVACLSEQGVEILKIKVGTDNDIDLLRRIRRIYKGRLRVDANCAWEKRVAVKMINEMERYGIEFVEQPVGRDDWRGMLFVKNSVSVPIYADESVEDIHDVVRASRCADGVVIKLMKCGGIHKSLQMIRTAKLLGLKVMIGCMVESALSITAAMNLAPLADHLDLDGHLMVTEDLFAGVLYERGQLSMPSIPGLGARLLARPT